MAITTTNSMLVAYRSVLWRFAVVVIVSQIVIRASNIVGLGGFVPFCFTLCVFMFVKIVSDFDSIKIRLCVVEVAVYAVVYFIRVKDLR